MRPAKVLTTRQHAGIDYLWAALLPVLPRLFGWDKPAKKIFTRVGSVAAMQSAITDYEGGGVKLMPMQAHLAMDGLIGVGLIALAALKHREPPVVRLTLLGAGLFALASTTMTQPIPQGAGRAKAQRTAQAVREYAGDAVGEMAGA